MGNAFLQTCTRQLSGVSYLEVVLDERELTGLQELSFGNVQAVLSVEELHHAAVTVPHRQVVLDHQTLEVLYHTPRTCVGGGGGTTHSTNEQRINKDS